MRAQWLNYFLLMIITGVLVYACGSSTQDKQELNKAKFSVVRIDTTFGDCSTGFCHEVSISYPVFSSDSLLNQAISRLLLTLRLPRESSLITPLSQEIAQKQLIEHEHETFQELTEIIQKEQVGFPSIYARYLVEVTWLTSQLVSFELSLDEFSGGAHPNYNARLVSFLVSDSPNELSYAKLFLADSLPVFTRLAKNAFYEKHQLNSESSLSEQGFWFENEEFKPNENFMLTQEGLVLFFNAYEVAPYVTGSTRLMLPWSRIRSLLAPEFASKISDN